MQRIFNADNIQNTTKNRQRAEHFDIGIVFLCHHIHELHCQKMVRFSRPTRYTQYTLIV